MKTCAFADTLTLTIEELQQLTGRKRPGAIAQWLLANGFTFRIGGDGYPRVDRQHYLAVMGAIPAPASRQRTEPNFDAMRAGGLDRPVMGRKRKHRKDLPARVTFEHGAYYFRRATDHKCIWLGRDYAEAMRKWADLLQRPIGALRVGAIMDAYLTSARFLKRKPRTQTDYREAIALLRPVFGAMWPEDIEPKHIYGYMSRRGAPVRANREVAVLSNVLQLAVELGCINKNPCKEVRRNEESPRIREVVDAEVLALLSYCPKWLKTYIQLKLLTGLRQGDMLQLTLRSIQEEGLFVVTGKRGKRLLFTWTPELRAAIDAVKAQKRRVASLYLFNSQRGTKFSARGFKAAWARAMKSALAAKALEERFAENDLRAKVATDARELGQDATSLLGHSSDAVTRRHYIRGTQKVEPLKKNIPQ